MNFTAGKVTVGKGAKVGRINTGVQLHGLDRKQAGEQLAKLATWQVVGGAVEVSGQAGDINSGLQLSFGSMGGAAVLDALRQDLAAVHDAIAALSTDDETPAPVKELAEAAAADLADAKAEAGKPKPLAARLAGRVKSAAEMLENLVKSAESGKKLTEIGEKAWPVLRDNWPKLVALAEMARHLPLPGL